MCAKLKFNPNLSQESFWKFKGINYNPGEPNYDLFKLACEVSAKRLFPNFSFVAAKPEVGQITTLTFFFGLSYHLKKKLL